MAAARTQGLEVPGCRWEEGAGPPHLFAAYAATPDGSPFDIHLHGEPETVFFAL